MKSGCDFKNQVTPALCFPFLCTKAKHGPKEGHDVYSDVTSFTRTTVPNGHDPLALSPDNDSIIPFILNLESVLLVIIAHCFTNGFRFDWTRGDGIKSFVSSGEDSSSL